jgi:hypothetical protein
MYATMPMRRTTTMRITLTTEQLATLELALQDRINVLRAFGGRGPLVMKQFDECNWLAHLLHQQLAAHSAKPKPKRKAKANAKVHSHLPVLPDDRKIPTKLQNGA